MTGPPDPASPPTVCVCMICRRLCTPAGRWIEIPEPVLRRLELDIDPLWLSHGLCPDCLREHYGEGPRGS